MIITEKDAKAKWCPFARAPGTVTRLGRDQEDKDVWHGAQNRGLAMGGPLMNCMCLASGCMAWRQAQKRLVLPCGESPGHADDGWQSSSVQPFEDGDGTHRLWENDRAGFCGLAGEP